MGHLPGWIYAELFNHSRKNRRSYKQLMLELIRDGLERNYGVKCPHDPKDRKYSRKIKWFYCAACGTFFERVFTGGRDGQFEFKALVPSWEIDKITKRPMGPLEEDLR